MKKSCFLSLVLMMYMVCANAQAKRIDGKIIPDYGQTFNVENPDVQTDINSTFKVIFDVSKSPKDASKVNTYIETAARFLNMHAESGMKMEQLKVAMTIHGGAWKDILADAIYLEKYGTKNPNSKLITQLSNAGVEIILCGQTARYREVSRLDMHPDVKLALSAMTALIQYQNKGYQFIKF